MLRYIYDFCVNTGSHAIKEVQQLLYLSNDGLIGTNTINSINAIGKNMIAFRSAINDVRSTYYYRLHNPHFEKGWFDRVNAIRTYVLSNDMWLQ